MIMMKQFTQVTSQQVEEILIEEILKDAGLEPLD